MTELLQLPPRCSRAQTGEEKADDHDGSSQPEGPKPRRPGLKVQPAQRDASCREQDDGNQEGEGAQDARGDWLETPGGFRTDGFDGPVDEKGDPEDGKKDSWFRRQRAFATNRGLRRVLTAPTLSTACWLATLIANQRRTIQRVPGSSQSIN
ncbi:MAG TPA: hypothetical protein VHZ55_28705 [Bryobacteraceae bacterium]|nr:hypothetical protein [Bryobacteraceae bacterium]